MSWHRILSGQTERPWQLKAAGLFVLIWFGMDAHQYADFIWQKWHPAPTLNALPPGALDLRGSVPTESLDDVPDLRIPDPEPTGSPMIYTGQCKPATFGNDMMVCW